MKLKLLIFDLDGTIADTLYSIRDGVNIAMEKYGLPILGNVTMYIPVKFKYDFWDVFTKGIEVAEDMGINL